MHEWDRIGLTWPRRWLCSDGLWLLLRAAGNHLWEGQQTEEHIEHCRYTRDPQENEVCYYLLPLARAVRGRRGVAHWHWKQKLFTLTLCTVQGNGLVCASDKMKTGARKNHEGQKRKRQKRKHKHYSTVPWVHLRVKT